MIFASFLTLSSESITLSYSVSALPRPKVRILLQSRHALELY